MDGKWNLRSCTVCATLSRTLTLFPYITACCISTSTTTTGFMAFISATFNVLHGLITIVIPATRTTVTHCSKLRPDVNFIAL